MVASEKMEGVGRRTRAENPAEGTLFFRRQALSGVVGMVSGRL